MLRATRQWLTKLGDGRPPAPSGQYPDDATDDPRGEGYIEAHHLKPVSSYEGEVKVDPEADMAVVCANCHRMIHRVRDDPLTIEQLRKIVDDHR